MAIINKTIGKDGGEIKINYHFNNKACSKDKLGYKKAEQYEWITAVSISDSDITIAVADNSGDRRIATLLMTVDGFECTKYTITIEQESGIQPPVNCVRGTDNGNDIIDDDVWSHYLFACGEGSSVNGMADSIVVHSLRYKDISSGTWEELPTNRENAVYLSDKQNEQWIKAYRTITGGRCNEGAIYYIYNRNDTGVVREMTFELRTTSTTTSNIAGTDEPYSVNGRTNPCSSWTVTVKQCRDGYYWCVAGGETNGIEVEYGNDCSDAYPIKECNPCNYTTANIEIVSDDVEVGSAGGENILIGEFSALSACSSSDFYLEFSGGHDNVVDIDSISINKVDGVYRVHANINKNNETSPKTERIRLLVNEHRCDPDINFIIRQQANEPYCSCNKISIPDVGFEWDDSDKTETLEVDAPASCIIAIIDYDDTDHFLVTATTTTVSIQPREANTSTTAYVETVTINYKLSDNSTCAKTFTATQYNEEEVCNCDTAQIGIISETKEFDADADTGLVIAEFSANTICATNDFSVVKTGGNDIAVLSTITFSYVGNNYVVFSNINKNQSDNPIQETFSIFINNSPCNPDINFMIKQKGND